MSNYPSTTILLMGIEQLGFADDEPCVCRKTSSAALDTRPNAAVSGSLNRSNSSSGIS
jgi:hypothetical protein